MARPLKIFMRGKSVTQLQELLRGMGFEIHDQKALFGVDTRSAVKAYQKQHSLKITGEVDEQFIIRMQGGAGATPKQSEAIVKAISSKQEPLDVLIQLLIKKNVFTQEEWDSECSKTKPSPLV
ncbi:MAG: peptidoglycan-binding domain-containing protein [Ghiorsea sp.]